MLHVEISMALVETKLAKEAPDALRDRGIELGHFGITWRWKLVEESLP